MQAFKTREVQPSLFTVCNYITHLLYEKTPTSSANENTPV